MPSVAEQKILDFNPIGHALLEHRRREEKRRGRGGGSNLTKCRGKKTIAGEIREAHTHTHVGQQ